MDREDGFTPHIVGFMRRKREKEKLATGTSLKTASREFGASGDESSRTSANA